VTKLAYVFPGQGSQTVGMLADVESLCSDLFAEASEVLGYDLWQLVAKGPEDRLNQTEFTQPALLTCSVALYRLSLSSGLPIPDALAGHSLGEYSALVAAEVLTFEDAVRLVQQRGRFMQRAVPLGKGGMAAVIGLSDDEVRAVCESVSDGDIVQAANFNAPGQVVIAGSTDAVKRGVDACKAAGAKRAMPLPVSAPFHSTLMRPAAEQMAEMLDAVTFSDPVIPVVQNVDALVHEDPIVIKEKLIDQICCAVLWTDTVKKLGAMGIRTLVECGPGKVLTGLAKRIDRSIESHNLLSHESISAVGEALGQ